MSARRLAALFAVCAVLLARAARADCPDSASPSLSVCEPHAAMLVPSALGMGYFPRDRADLGAFVGGGVEVLLFSWLNSNESFGPGAGKFRFDVAGLGSTHDGTKAMVMWRGGASVAFEKNPSRSWLLPYFGVDIGGLYQRDVGGRFTLDPSFGLYAVYTKHFILDVEGSYVFPFSDFDELYGPKAQLTASFELW